MGTTGKWVAVVMGLVVAGALTPRLRGQAVGPPPLKLGLTSLVPEAVIEVAGDRLAVTSDEVWVSNRAAGTLTRIDPQTYAVGKPLAMGEGTEPCLSLLPAFKSLWIPLCGSPGLARLETAAGKPPVVISLGVYRAGPVVTGTSSIWMITDPDGTLSRLDPDANGVVAEVTVPPGAGAVAFGHDAVWVTSSTRNVVTRVNGHTNVVLETIKVGPAPSSVAVGAGAVWVLNGGDGSVSRIDPKSNKVVETIKTGVPQRGGMILVGEGSVWVSAPGAPLTRIDPDANLVRQQFSGTGGGVMAIGLNSLWLGPTPSIIWRLDPRRIEATRK